jgi:hypothetical protein
MNSSGVPLKPVTALLIEIAIAIEAEKGEARACPACPGGSLARYRPKRDASSGCGGSGQTRLPSGLAQTAAVGKSIVAGSGQARLPLGQARTAAKSC